MGKYQEEYFPLIKGWTKIREKKGLIFAIIDIILNQYSQLDWQEAVVFGQWSLKGQSHKEEENRQACSKSDA